MELLHKLVVQRLGQGCNTTFLIFNHIFWVATTFLSNSIGRLNKCGMFDQWVIVIRMCNSNHTTFKKDKIKINMNIISFCIHVTSIRSHR
jgi:hypothetical protein